MAASSANVTHTPRRYQPCILDAIMPRETLPACTPTCNSWTSGLVLMILQSTACFESGNRALKMPISSSSWSVESNYAACHIVTGRSAQPLQKFWVQFVIHSCIALKWITLQALNTLLESNNPQIMTGWWVTRKGLLVSPRSRVYRLKQS